MTKPEQPKTKPKPKQVLVRPDKQMLARKDIERKQDEEFALRRIERELYEL